MKTLTLHSMGSVYTVRSGMLLHRPLDRDGNPTGQWSEVVDLYPEVCDTVNSFFRTGFEATVA